MNDYTDIDPENPDKSLGNFAGLVKRSQARWSQQANEHDARTAKFAARLWQAERDDALTYPEYPLDDSEPLQRDLFK